MTRLLKPIRRETEAVFRKRNLIVQIEPPNIIRVREKGTRTWMETTLEAVYCMAARQTAERNRQMKKEARRHENHT